MSDETGPDWEAEHERAARGAAALWAIELLAAQPELMELIPPKRRILYAARIEKADDDD